MPGHRALVAKLQERAGVRPAAEVRGADGAVEIVRRKGTDASYLFVVNHSESCAELTAHGYELVTGTPVAGHVDVPGGAVRIM